MYLMVVATEEWPRNYCTLTGSLNFFHNIVACVTRKSWLRTLSPCFLKNNFRPYTTEFVGPGPLQGLNITSLGLAPLSV